MHFRIKSAKFMLTKINDFAAGGVLVSKVIMNAQ